jgi:nucleotide-binding universal stress UspA family protein
MTPRRILCPIDFSAGATHAFRVAARLACELDVELEIVHAWHLPPFTVGGEAPLPADAIQTLVDDAQRGLTDAIADAHRLGCPHVTSQLVSGPPWERITELARPTDLIVMGTHGRTGVSRFLLGSVAEKVVRHAPCAVLVARPHGPPERFKHLLVPVDFSETSKLALERAAELASRTGARVTLLHVLDMPDVLLPQAEPPATAALDEWADLLEQRTSHEVQRVVRTGVAAAQVLALASEDPTIDLIVMGSHGRVGIRRFVLGSVAEKIVRHASLPVLVAR